MPIRVAIAGESRLSGEGLRRILASDAAFEVVGEADAVAARDLIHEKRPDILLVDSRMAGVLGFCADLRRAACRPWTILIWATKTVLTHVVEELAALSEAGPQKCALLLNRLSPRELEVLRQAADGPSNKEIAGRLDMSQATVKAHLTHIFQKLGLRDRVQLAGLYHGMALPFPPVPRRRPD